MLSDEPTTGQSTIQNPETLLRQALGDRYEIQGVIGRGGMATVYKALQKNLNRTVALKVIHQNLVHDTEFVSRFIREAQVSASLNHPNIVTVYDVGSVGSVHYMAMELLEGKDLHQMVKQNGALHHNDVVKWMIPVADALDYIHQKGLLHRDIKSSNILVTNDGRPVLMDFGIAHAADGTKLTQTGTVIGTPEYMSPEQAEGKPMDNRSDLYSLGVVMYECLTGKVPFKGDNPLTTIHKVIYEEPQAITMHNLNIPGWLNSVVLKLLTKEKNLRFSTGKAMATALQKRERVAFSTSGKQNTTGDQTQKMGAAGASKKQNTSNTHQKSSYSKPPPSSANKGNPNQWIKWAAAAVVLFILIVVVININQNQQEKKRLVAAEKQRKEMLAEQQKAEEQRQAEAARLEREQKAKEREKAEAARQESERNAKEREKVEAARLEERRKAEEQRKAEAARKESILQKYGMVLVEGGTFRMGSNDGNSDEKPVHSVTLSSFYISKYECTQQLWQEIMGSNPSRFKGGNNPVERVSWNDVQEFIKKLNQKTGMQFRLPTEAEWEFAARGGNNSRGYTYAGSNSIGGVGWYNVNSDSRTHPVGQKQANELGLYDMSGNVYEWCADWYDSDYYSSSPQQNPQGPPSGSNRVIRGGSWYYVASYCRVAIRSYDGPDNRYDYFGFRLSHSSGY